MWRVTTLFTGPQITGGGINEMHFQGVGDANDAWSACSQFWGTLAGTMYAGNNAVVQADVEEIDVASGDVEGIETFAVDTNIGGNSNAPLPPTVQGLLRFRTGVRVGKRELRGRVFVPAQDEVNSVAGIPTAGVLGVFQGAIDILVADGDAGFGIYSRKAPELGRAAGTFAAAVSGSPWTQWASLRSRRD